MTSVTKNQPGENEREVKLQNKRTLGIFIGLRIILESVQKEFIIIVLGWLFWWKNKTKTNGFIRLLRQGTKTGSHACFKTNCFNYWLSSLADTILNVILLFSPHDNIDEVSSHLSSRSKTAVSLLMMTTAIFGVFFFFAFVRQVTLHGYCMMIEFSNMMQGE